MAASDGAAFAAAAHQLLLLKELPEEWEIDPLSFLGRLASPAFTAASLQRASARGRSPAASAAAHFRPARGGAAPAASEANTPALRSVPCRSAGAQHNLRAAGAQDRLVEAGQAGGHRVRQLGTQAPELHSGRIAASPGFLQGLRTEFVGGDGVRVKKQELR